MNAQQTNQAFEQLFQALKLRNIAAESKDNSIAMSFMINAEKSIKTGLKHFKNETIQSWISTQACDKKGAIGFVAVKVNVKILHFISAIGAKETTAIDGYSAAIISNTFANDNTLTAKSALITLCKGLEYDAMDLVQTIRNRCRVAVTTASTQRSSSREAMRVLGLADVTKNKRDDKITLSEDGVRVFASLFQRDEIVSEA